MMVHMILLGQLSIIPTNNRDLLCTESEYKFDLLHETCRERSGDCVFLPLTRSAPCLLWEDRIDMVTSSVSPSLGVLLQLRQVVRPKVLCERFPHPRPGH